MDEKTKLLAGLGVMMIIDIFIPVPIIGLILVYVVLQRPPWFMNLVREVYKEWE